MKFGTDGIRGMAGVELTPEVAMKLGFHAARLLVDGMPRARFVVGKDPRLSSDMLEAALCSGITLAGANALRLGVVTTPAVPFVLRSDGFAGGFMITASHNPIQDNGIKVFGPDGYKLADGFEKSIEKGIAGKIDYSKIPAPHFGKSKLESASVAQYVKFLRNSLKSAGLNRANASKNNAPKIVFDCAYGAASGLCREVFHGFPGEFTFINAEFDGTKINCRCGATDLVSLKRAVKKAGADFGVAFDGDGDRALIVDSGGKEIDGDKILGLLAENVPIYRQSGAVVATVMSNFGLEEFLGSLGIKLIRMPVGDKYVLQGLLENGALLGGEQSGHIVMLDRSHAGDGILTAAAVTGVICSTGKSIEELTKGVKKYPQFLTNVEVSSKAGWDKDRLVAKSLDEIGGWLNSNGRLLVRPSGTEPLIRVMAESRSKEMAKSAVEMASTAIREWNSRVNMAQGVR